MTVKYAWTSNTSVSSSDIFININTNNNVNNNNINNEDKNNDYNNDDNNILFNDNKAYSCIVPETFNL